jgi:hypothetical protein
MTGNTLANVLTKLKAELGTNLTIGTADDARYYEMIETRQEWYSSLWDWNVLRDTWEATVTPGAVGQYPTVPTQDANGNAFLINFDRPINVSVRYSAKWQEVLHGIGVDEMNVWDSDAGEASDPVQRWQLKDGDSTKFEIWPLGVAASQEIRFDGQRKLQSLRTAGVFVTTKVLDLDDRLIYLSLAADILTGKEDPSARSKADMLESLWKTLRSAESKSARSFALGAGVGKTLNSRKVVPITVG